MEVGMKVTFFVHKRELRGEIYNKPYTSNLNLCEVCSSFNIYFNEKSL